MISRWYLEINLVAPCKKQSERKDEVKKWLKIKIRSKPWFKKVYQVYLENYYTSAKESQRLSIQELMVIAKKPFF